MDECLFRRQVSCMKTRSDDHHQRKAHNIVTTFPVEELYLCNMSLKLNGAILFFYRLIQSLGGLLLSSL